jgi:acetyl/propionyl-CoA carboxylase alpha subunit
MTARTDAKQVEIKADRKAYQARMEANKEDMLAEISASMKSNEYLLARLEARMEINMEKDREDLKEMREEIKSVQAEMRSTVCAMRSELKETIQYGMNIVTTHTFRIG